MDEEGKPPRVVVTEAWRKEQQAKREAYEAKRRAWARMLESGSEADEGEAPTPGGPAASGAAVTGDVTAIPARRRRRDGTIQDRRQARFTF
jgi:hypothetical protein